MLDYQAVLIATVIERLVQIVGDRRLLWQFIPPSGTTGNSETNRRFLISLLSTGLSLHCGTFEAKLAVEPKALAVVRGDLTGHVLPEKRLRCARRIPWLRALARR
jgi:hypothetical protein